MGCVIGRRRRPRAESERSNREQQQSTCDKYMKISQPSDQNDEDYVFEKLEGGVVSKAPGQINGEDFAIDNCKNTTIFIFDNTSVVNVDDCKHCHIFIGPCKGSVFIRDCSDCVLMVACQQFRTRDCHRCTIYLHCTSQPVIEESLDMRFGCFQCSYPELKAQFKAAGLSLFNNNWSSIHDFTPEIGETWSLIQPGTSVPRLSFPPDNADSTLLQVDASFDPSSSLVIFTHGTKHIKQGAEECLVVFFTAEDTNERAMELAQNLREIDEMIFVTTKELKMKEVTMNTLFSNHPSPPQYTVNETGSMIIIQLQGPSAVSHCSTAVSQNAANTPLLVYCSPNAQQARADITNYQQILNNGLIM